MRFVVGYMPNTLSLHIGYARTVLPMFFSDHKKIYILKLEEYDHTGYKSSLVVLLVRHS
jgi:hypothetical protein